MNTVGTEKPYWKFGWMILAFSAFLGLAAGLYLAIFSHAPYDLPAVKNLTGMSWAELAAQSPAAASLAQYFITEFWIADATVYALALGVALTGYRKGERWAYALSIVVFLYGVAYIFTSAAAGGTLWPNWITHLTLELAGLLLPFRKFFPKAAQPALA